MHPRARDLIRLLGLERHPEGGFFVRVHRSEAVVTPSDGRSARRAFSAIHYLLVEGDLSRWHRVASDEAWHFYEGSPLELHEVPAAGGTVTRHLLGPVSDASSPLHVVPAGAWQAARPTGPYSFVGCSLGPGFEFDDFRLLADVPVDERPVFVPPSLLHAFL